MQMIEMTRMELYLLNLIPVQVKLGNNVKKKSFNKEASAKNKSLFGIKSKLREFLDFLESTIINGTGKAGKEVSGR